MSREFTRREALQNIVGVPLLSFLPLSRTRRASPFEVHRKEGDHPKTGRYLVKLQPPGWNKPATEAFSDDWEHGVRFISVAPQSLLPWYEVEDGPIRGVDDINQLLGDMTQLQKIFWELESCVHERTADLDWRTLHYVGSQL